MSKSIVVGKVSDDGYSIQTRIKPLVARVGEVELHGNLSFDRRPTGADTVAAFYDFIEGKKESQILKKACEVIASKIVKWDAVDEKGNSVPITPAGVESLHWKIIARLRDIICLCQEAGDPIEDNAEKPSSDEELMATLRGNS